MSSMASQTTSLTIVYSTVYSSADQRKHQSSASLVFVWWPVNSPHKGPVMRKMFPFDDVIMNLMHSIWQQLHELTPICLIQPPPTAASWWRHFTTKTTFPDMDIPILKIRGSQDRLFYTIGIPWLVRRHLYIEAGPERYSAYNHKQFDCLFTSLLGKQQTKHQSTALLAVYVGNPMV